MTTPQHTDDNGNGKVTVAVLGERIENLTDLLKEIQSDVKEVKAAVNEQKVAQGVQANEIEHIKKTQATWNIGNAIGAAFAAVLAWYTK